MEKEVFDYVSERVDILAQAGTSKQETKDAAHAWKEAVLADSGNEAVEAATTKLLDFLEGRPTTLDGLLSFLEGPAKEFFGEEQAAQMQKMQQQRKANGEQFCNCDACKAASEILAKFGRVELVK